MGNGTESHPKIGTITNLDSSSKDSAAKNKDLESESQDFTATLGTQGTEGNNDQENKRKTLTTEYDSFLSL